MDFKKYKKASNDSGNCTAGVIKAGSDRRVSASADNGISDYALVLPSGILSVPSMNDDAVVIPTASGHICVGIRGSYHGFYPSSGEIVIYNPVGTRIWLKNDGKIEISGDIEIDGNIVIKGNVSFAEEDS